MKGTHDQSHAGKKLSEIWGNFHLLRKASGLLKKMGVKILTSFHITLDNSVNLFEPQSLVCTMKTLY